MADDRYITTWRLHLARAALQNGDATVAQLADKLGYRSEAASSAFSNASSARPGAARRAGTPPLP